MRQGYLAIAGLLVIMHALPARAQRQERLYIASHGGDDVTVIDIDAQRVIASVPVAAHVTSVAVSRDGARLYAVVEPPDGSTGLVAAFDAASYAELWRVETGWQNHDITLSPDDELLYVTIFGEEALLVLDAKTGARVTRIDVGYGPHNTRSDPASGRVYTGTIHQHELTAVDPATQTVVQRIPLGEGVRPFAFTADGRAAYVQLSRLHGAVRVDIEKGVITDSIHLPPPEDGLPKLTWPYNMVHGIALSADGTVLVLNSVVGRFAALYSVPEHRLLARIDDIGFPRWATCAATRPLCFVTDAERNEVVVISVEQRREIARIPAGQGPHRMTTAPAPATGTHIGGNEP